MDILIQNLGQAPLMLNVKNSAGDAIDRVITFEPNTVVKVPAEIYEKLILTSPFYRNRIQDGVIRILNKNNAEEAANNSVQLRDHAYDKYVDLMKKIKSAGGASNPAFRPHLNSDGTPTLALLNINFGRNIDPQIAEEFRVRFLAENQEGLHEDTIKLPGVGKVDAGNREVKIIEEKDGGEDNGADGEDNGEKVSRRGRKPKAEENTPAPDKE